MLLWTCLLSRGTFRNRVPEAELQGGEHAFHCLMVTGVSLWVTCRKVRLQKVPILSLGHARRVRPIELRACFEPRTPVCWHSTLGYPTRQLDMYVPSPGGWEGFENVSSNYYRKEVLFWGTWPTWLPSVSCLNGGTMAISSMEDVSFLHGQSKVSSSLTLVL